jgi:hypothetical protein
MFTFRDQCLAQAALVFLAQQEAMPVQIRDLATNAGQFRAEPADAAAAAKRISHISLASTLVGDLRQADVGTLAELITEYGPVTTRQERAAFRRQGKFLHRVTALLTDRASERKR